MRASDPSLALLLMCSVCCTPVGAQQSVASKQLGKRPVTVADAIQMRSSADALQGRPIAHYSPDDKKFVAILKKGNLTRNTNEFSLVLWSLDDRFHWHGPEVLLMMSSSSNRDAIANVTWLQDGVTVAFLGEHPGELQQVYTFNIRTRVLKRVTRHPTNLLSYSITPGGQRIAYIAEEPLKTIWDAKTLRKGVLVSTQPLTQLLAGLQGGGGWGGGYGVFYSSLGATSKGLKTIGKIRDYLGSELKVSPDGKYVVVATALSTIHEDWSEYDDPDVHNSLPMTPAKSKSSWLKQFELIDTESGTARVLLDAPQTWGYAAAWLPNSRSIVLSDVYLPLNGTNGDERAARRSAAFGVEIKIPSRDIVRIGPAGLKVLDAKANRVTFEVQKKTQNWKHGPKVFFSRDGDRWVRVPAPEEAQPEILLKQDMNTPPAIVAVDPDTRDTTLLLDLNPQFNELQFARVEAITWKGADGHDARGGIYYPVGYVRGKRYPLVVQTHWFTPDLFWIDGPWTTAFAAQPLAGRGIMVLQADEDFTEINSPREVQREASTFDGAVQYLGEQGLIDSNRVGLVGFSRTCLFVKYALTHSQYHFAAASVTDGMDGGYFQYIMTANSCPDCVRGAEGINEGLPFGDGLGSWIVDAPAFSIDRVHTPLLITALNAQSLAGEWEWFSGLTRLERPVEMIYLRDGLHELKKPWERVISSGGNADWFAFWLKGEEDPDPAKAEQYARWRDLRKLQHQQAAADTGVAPQ